eukprot:Nitzschia sp. Nitz4//scaffold52_size167869//34323//36162//NITZ4_002265-RA/size167869-snap-gene-0.222-mRNA-1//-1//CDS//3329554002//2036//frame0
MFNFSGYLRDEEEWAVGGDWGNPCGDLTSACPGSSTAANCTTSPTDHIMQANCMRIDMAAAITEGAGEAGIEMAEKGSVHSKGTNSTELKTSDIDEQSYGEERELEEKRCCAVFSGVRCFSRVTAALCGILSLYVMGMGIGLILYRSYDVDTNTSAANSGGFSLTPAPTPGWQPVSPPTSPPTMAPTRFDFNIDDNVFDWDDDDALTREEYFDDDDDSFIVSGPYLVGAYYYPWYGSTFHNGGGYMREDLEPQHLPELGEYDDSKASTITKHLKWSRQANIGLWIASWWGPNKLEDNNIRNVILNHKDIDDMMVAVHYETTGRVKFGLSTVVTDMEWFCEHYWNHDNYYKINGRPVLFVYVTRKLENEGTLEETILAMRTSAGKCGHQVYIVGDHVFDEAPDINEDFVPFWYFDAVTNYDVYGSMGRPSPYAGKAVVSEYYDDMTNWRTRAIANNCRFIPAVSPGYNDRGVRLSADHPPLSRKLTEDGEPGSLFAYQLKKAKKIVDPEVDNLIVVNSFNEWHEDTQIEPVEGERTNLPYNFTKGLYYEGYGELYLDILRNYTAEG